MARILVTGGAGFIGSHLVDKLIEKKHTVAVVDDLSTGKKSYINPKSKFIKAKIQSKSIERVYTSFKPEVIYHLAAQKNLQYSKMHPILDAETNILGSLRVIELAKKYRSKKIIFYSTAAVYDPWQKQPVREDSHINPITPYGIGKYSVEKYLENSGLNFTILRLANVFGPRQDAKGEGGVVAIFSQQFSKRLPVKINNSGKQTRDYVYVEDVVDASILSMRKASGNILNISTTKETSVNELHGLLEKISGHSVKKVRGSTLKEQERSALVNLRAKRVLGWRPKYTLRKGLEETLSWFR